MVLLVRSEIPKGLREFRVPTRLPFSQAPSSDGRRRLHPLPPPLLPPLSAGSRPPAPRLCPPVAAPHLHSLPPGSRLHPLPPPLPAAGRQSAAVSPSPSICDEPPCLRSGPTATSPSRCSWSRPTRTSWTGSPAEGPRTSGCIGYTRARDAQDMLPLYESTGCTAISEKQQYTWHVSLFSGVQQKTPLVS